MPQQTQKLSLKTIATEYGIILRNPTSLGILTCIAFIFMGFFVFLTSLPLFMYRFSDLEGVWGSLVGLIFPCGVFIGSFYQSTWGWAFPPEKVMRICWWVTWLSLGMNILLVLLFPDMPMALYAGCMMCFGGGLSIVNSLSSTLLMRHYPPSIAGTLSSVIGITQTLSGGLGSLLVVVTPLPFVALLLIFLTTALSYISYLFFRAREEGTAKEMVEQTGF